MRRKTTHEIAQELLALPDVPLAIEGWIQQEWMQCEMVAEMTEYDPEGEAIIWQKPTEHQNLENEGEKF